MREYLKKLPKAVQDLISRAQGIASCNKMPAYLVGGFVRDLILGVENLDLDIVVEGDGIRFAEEFAKHLKAKLIRHRRFGTATIILKPHLKIDPSTPLRVNGESFDIAQDASKDAEPVEARSRTIDIASARKEFYPRPAQLPIVTAGKLKDDLLRRDFTINAMGLSIDDEDFGKLIDLFKGKADLDNKKIRILHNLSFIDDPTRILRAIRFEKRYDFKIEPKTLKLLKEAVKFKMLGEVQPQRIRDDLILILKEKHPLKEIKRLQELVGFGFISPRLSVSVKAYKLIRAIERQINWFKITYPQRRLLDTWLIYFMGLIDALNIADVNAVCKKFVFRKGEEKRIFTYKKIKHKFILGLNKKKIRPSEIFAIFEPLSYEAILLLKAKYKNRQIQQHIEDFFEIYNGMRIQIRGDDLHKLGVTPGPYYQKIFTQVLKAKLNGLVKTKDEELALIKKLIEAV